MTGSIRVLIADDEALVRAGFRLLAEFAEGLEVVGEAATGAEAVNQARGLRPDVVLMDIRMPVMDGIEATGALLAQPHAPRVLVVTTFDDDENVFAALGAGASGFVFKDSPPEQLIEAIRVVAAGAALLAPSVTRRLIAEFPGRRGPALPARRRGAGRPDRARARGARSGGRGPVNAEIAAALHVSAATVKTHVAGC